MRTILYPPTSSNIQLLSFYLGDFDYLALAASESSSRPRRETRQRPSLQQPGPCYHCHFHVWDSCCLKFYYACCYAPQIPGGLKHHFWFNGIHILESAIILRCRWDGFIAMYYHDCELNLNDYVMVKRDGGWICIMWMNQCNIATMRYRWMRCVMCDVNEGRGIIVIGLLFCLVFKVGTNTIWVRPSKKRSWYLPTVPTYLPMIQSPIPETYRPNNYPW